MTCRRHFCSLFKKNWLLKTKRSNLCGFVCELVLPILCVLIMIGLWKIFSTTSYETQAYINPWGSSDEQVRRIAPYFVVPNRLAYANWRLAVIPATPALAPVVNQFVTAMAARYPPFNGTLAATVNGQVVSPSLAKFNSPGFAATTTTAFASEAALADYIARPDYGLDGQFKVWAAIVFNAPPPNLDYSLRFNYTEVPDTRVASVNPLQRGYSATAINKYEWSIPSAPGSGNPFAGKPAYDPIIYSKLPGYMSLQLMIDRWAINTSAAPAVPPTAMDVNATLYAWTYMLSLAAPSGLGVGFTRDVQSLLANNASAAAQVFSNIASYFSLGESYAPQTVDLVPFPITAFTNNSFYVVAAQIFAFFFVCFTFWLPVSRLIRSLVQEKETKIREGMRQMGVSDAAVLFSWLSTYTLMYLLIAAVIALMTRRNIFANSNGFLVFVFFALFGISTTTFAYLVSVFFSRAKTASTLGIVLFLGAFFPWFAVTDPDYDNSAKVGSSILSPTAFGLSLDLLVAYENEGNGIQFGNLWTSYNNYSYATGLLMMILDTFLYGVLAWYLEAVMPASIREFGVPLPWDFPCSRSYWQGTSLCCCCGRGGKDDDDDDGNDGIGEVVAKATGTSTPAAGATAGCADAAIDPAVKARFIEEPDANLKALEAQGKCITIRGLRKEFDTPDGKKVAVDGVDLTLYQGEVVCLLGANGAGKTTTISMLTGMLEPSAGQLKVFGKDISRHMGKIRKMLGVCPQHDVLWPELTVKEHLDLFASIKDVPKASVNEEVMKAIAAVGLTEKVNVPASSLSGGQKRKLSTAIALLGGSKILVLDEPSSGMDPYSRRSLFAVIEAAKKEGRAVLLVTHFLDEADLLGDRIAIMAEGKVQCSGSPMFLKQAFGVGYVLTFVKALDATPGAGDAILETVKRHCPSATVATSAGAELALRVPFSASPAFPALFNELDSRKRELCITNYGVSVTTLEEIFLRVAAGEGGLYAEYHKQKLLDKAKAVAMPVPLSGSAASSSSSSSPGGIELTAASAATKPSSSSSLATKSSKASAAAIYERAAAGGGFRKLAVHFRALFLKRMSIAKRDYRAMICQVLLPIVMVAVGLALLKSGAIGVFPSVQLTTAVFNVNNRIGRYIPQQPNLVPVFDYKSTASPTDAAASQLVGLVSGMPSPNVTSLPSMQFTVAQAAAIPNTFGLLTQYGNASSLGYPTYDWLRASEFLLNDKRNWAASKYGAYVFTKDGTYYSAAQNASTTAPASSIVTYSTLFNTTGRDAGPTFVNLMNSRLYSVYSGNPTASITARNDPLPLTKRQGTIFSAIFSFFSAALIVLAFAFIPASYAVFVVKERETRSKHQQLISGVSIPAYWLSTFLFDVASFVIPGAVTIGLCFAYGVNDFTGTENNRIGALVALVFLYGLATASFTYMLSFLFTSHSTAQNALLLLNVFAMILLIASFIMGQVGTTCRADEGLKFVYRLIPGFSLGNGLLQLAFLDILPLLEATCDRAEGVTKPLSPPYKSFDLKAAGYNMIYLGAEAVIYLVVAIVTDMIRSNPRLLMLICPTRDPVVVDPPFEPESDVEDEVRRCAAESDAAVVAARSGNRAVGPDGSVVLLNKLRKAYPGGKVAVKGLSYGIKRGEILGFLGLNGAGKSSTLNMLGGEVLPSAGSARIAGFDVVSEQSRCRSQVGFVPQVDPLLELLTAKEHLQLFARIKGVPEEQVEATCEEQMRRFDLTQYANKKAGTLSGGNKRKLCIAIALTGPGNIPPPVVILDEPSTGVDPVAKRHLWRVLADLCLKEKALSVILTTHSMEECEALASRVGIMVGGRLRCLGTPQHLRSKYGKGFQVEVKLAEPSSEAIERVVAIIAALMPSAPAAVAGAVAVPVPVPEAEAAGTTTVAPAAAHVPVAAPVAAPLPTAASSAAASATSRPLIARSQLGWLCTQLGQPGRYSQVCESGSGWSVHASFERSALPSAGLPPLDGRRSVSADEFAAWWASEDDINALVGYFSAEAFPGTAILERQGTMLRMSIPPQDDPLGTVFAKVEAVRARVGVVGLSLNEQTLEQIFIRFSRLQDEEKGVARGFAAAEAVAVAVPVPVPALQPPPGVSSAGIGATAASITSEDPAPQTNNNHNNHASE